MIVLAVVLGVDPLYVGVHHAIRFLGIGFALPFMFPQRGRNKKNRRRRPGISPLRLWIMSAARLTVTFR